MTKLSKTEEVESPVNVGVAQFDELSAPAQPAVSTSRQEYLELIKQSLPEDHQPYTDKYFLRTNEILKKEGLNPYVRSQVFIRKGPGEVYGMDKAIAALDKYTDLKKNGGAVYAKDEGEAYESKVPVMFIDGYAQDYVELETFYLGNISADTTKANDGAFDVDLQQVKETVEKIVSFASERPVYYLGARHWSYDVDAAISNAAYEGGAVGASTDIGAATAGQEGMGTIPHFLENVFAWKYGAENAVVEATKAFDRCIDKSVPRIALIDYNNKEITDSLATAEVLGDRLFGVRVDTCGENVAEGALPNFTGVKAQEWKAKGLPLPDPADSGSEYWTGTGVTITGVYALRKALNDAGYQDVKIVLSSGFGKPEKVKAFVEAEEKLGIKLFDALGVGGVYSPCRAATMDIVFAGEDSESLVPMSKEGRNYIPNLDLKPKLFAN